MFSHHLKYKNQIIENYMMDDNGNIYSYNSNKILKPFPNKEGKMEVCLSIDNVKKFLRLDYLIISTLKTFYDDIIHIMYLDNNFRNCTLDNLLIVRKSDIYEKYKAEYHVDNLEEITESWKQCSDLSNVEISNFGNARYTDTKLEIPSFVDHGYKLLRIKNNNHCYVFTHRLVATMFVENPRPNEFTYVNHIDGDKLNNVFYNLEWCNISMNTEHAQLTGLINKYDEKNVRTICELLEQGLPHTQIEILTGINRKYISEIYRGRRWRSISSEYDFKRRIPLSELYNGEVVLALLKTGHTVKNIAELLKIEYNNSFASFCRRLSNQI